MRQSERFALYQARFDALVAAGRIYPAYESAQELDLKRKILLGRGLPPVYDRAALTLSDAQKAHCRRMASRRTGGSSWIMTHRSIGTI